MKRYIRIVVTMLAMAALGFVVGRWSCDDVRTISASNLVRHRIPRVVYAGNPDDGSAELRVAYPERPGESRRLFAYGRSATASFDSTGEWCAVSDQAGSSESYTRVFRRCGDLDYAEVADISDAAWKFFESRGNLLPDGPYDHNYVNPVSWIPGDKPLLLVSLTGHGSIGVSTDCWLCVYDPVAGRFLSEFEASDDKGVRINEAARRRFFKDHKLHLR